jgi:hypothetical protein
MAATEPVAPAISWDRQVLAESGRGRELAPANAQYRLR